MTEGVEPQPSDKPAARISRRWLGLGVWLMLAALVTYYLISYALDPLRPRMGALGWWGWADQGEYLKSVKAFASGHWTSGDFLYPPLYALTAAPFLRLAPLHPFLIPDALMFAGFFAVLVVVTRRFYGWILPVGVCVALFAAAPNIMIQQWVIPWTSTLAATLASVLIALFARAERRATPFALSSRADWLLFAGFFLAYGGLAPTRPLDIIVWFPFALAFFVRSTLATTLQAPAGRRPLAFLACSALAGLCGATLVLLFLLFNLKVQGQMFGAYSSMSLDHGYLVTEIGEKALSLFRTSQTLFAEQGQAVFQKYPFLVVNFAIAIVALFAVRDVRFWILLTIFCNFAVYLPYGDLLPTGFFRYANNHYFKWAWPWLTVVTVGEALRWLGGLVRGSRRAAALLAASAAVLTIGAEIDLVPVNLAVVADVRDGVRHSITIRAPQRRSVQFIDVAGLQGGRDQFDSPQHQLFVDGRLQSNSMHRFYPSDSGGRIIFLEPTQVFSVTLITDPKLAYPSGSGKSVVGSVAIRFGCLPGACVLLHPVNWSGGQILFGFGLGGDLHGAALSGWMGPEPWGRWSSEPRAAISFSVRPPAAGGLWVASRFGGIAGGKRHKRAHVSLWVNGCNIGKRALTPGEKETVEGALPRRCWRNGALTVEWRTDAVQRPSDVYGSQDNRPLGVAVDWLSMRETP